MYFKTSVIPWLLLLALIPRTVFSQGLRIGFLIDSIREQRYTIDRAAIEKLARKDGNELLFASSGGDPDRQLAKARDLIRSGVRVLIVQPVDPVRAAAIVRTASASGVPVISYDRPIKSPHVAFYVTHDHRAVGKLQAEAAIGFIDEFVKDRSLPVLICAGPEGVAVADEITRANRESLSRAGIRQIVVRRHAYWSEDECKASTLRQLARGPLAAVLANNGSMAVGALGAIKTRGGKQPVFVAGADGSADECRLVKEGRLHASVLKPIQPLAKAAYEAALKLAAGHVFRGRAASAMVPVRLARKASLSEAYLSPEMEGFEEIRKACAL